MICDANNTRLCGLDTCDNCFNRSFASHPKAIYWAQGSITPRQVFKNCNDIFWFKCGVCNHEFTARPNDVNRNKWCPYCANIKLCNKQTCMLCFNKSFASHPRNTHWSAKNPENTRNLFSFSHKKYWFSCDNCPHEFIISLDHINKGRWCPYCSNRKLCDDESCEMCFNKSFASHFRSIHWSTKNIQPARMVFKNAVKKYWFFCDRCLHEFDTRPHDIIGHNQWCRYCANQDLCSNEFCAICWDKSFETYHRSVNWDFDKNYPITPRDVLLQSNKKFWFTCDKKHKFASIISNIIKDRWCPICKHKTQEKLLEWLRCRYPDYTIISEATFDWCTWEPTGKKCRYDFYIVELELLIELDGPQHFQQISNWQCPEKTQEKDIFKMNKAVENGKSVIRIIQEDVLYDRTNWRNNLSGTIQKYKTHSIIYIGDSYKPYKSSSMQE